MLLISALFLLFSFLIMNIVVWNCMGALKPNFQSHIRELVRCHNPDVFVVMETHLGVIELRIFPIVFLLIMRFIRRQWVLLGVFGSCGMLTKWRLFNLPKQSKRYMLK